MFDRSCPYDTALALNEAELGESHCGNSSPTFRSSQRPAVPEFEDECPIRVTDLHTKVNYPRIGGIDSATQNPQDDSGEDSPRRDTEGEDHDHDHDHDKMPAPDLADEKGA
ncbi:MAG: hypothetical protein HIU84_03150 [Acidobacteria bacterium]|nr:hypothetical protein [Acidobacteriota bacterium]